MAKQAKDYRITTGYGYIPGYPLNGGFHRGEDRIMPIGTPILVNGVKIGTSGVTGFTTGAHLHIGKWGASGVMNPKGAGFSFKSALVTTVDPYNDDANGRFVRIRGDGYNWVYLHMNTISVRVGQKLVAPKPTKPTYPKQVMVKSKAGANVRDKPTTESRLAGSKFLKYGTKFTVKGKVKGQTISGNPYWYQTSHNNFVWTGNIT